MRKLFVLDTNTWNYMTGCKFLRNALLAGAMEYTDSTSAWGEEWRWEKYGLHNLPNCGLNNIAAIFLQEWFRPS